MNKSVSIIPQANAALAAALCTLLLTGCSVFRMPDEPAYQRAEQARDLEVPPDLSSPASRGGVPDVVAAEASAGELDEFDKFKQFEQWEEFEQYRQWKNQADVDEKLDFQAFMEARKAVREEGSAGAGVSVETNFDQSRDVRVSANAQSTMEYVDAALTSMGVPILARNPEKFRIDVSLPEVRESSLFKPSGDHFSLSIGRDQQDMIVALVNSNGERVDSPEATRFMNRLAGEIRLVKVRREIEERVAQPRDKPGTIRATEGGHIELDLADSGERVWTQIDYVIDQIGFTVLDRNPDDLSFRIRYLTDEQVPEERTGLAKLAFWKDDQTLPEGADIYTVKVAESGSGSTVRVVDVDGQPSDTADAILELLRDKL